MFVFTGHRGPGRCRRSKNKSSTDFWSFVWRISPQYFWHIFTFACFCFTELATQQMLFLFVSASSAENTRVLCSKTAITPLPGGWFRHTPISRSQSRRWIAFLKKKFSLLLNFHLIPILNSPQPMPRQISIISIPVSQLKILNSSSEFPIETLGRFPENQIAKSRMTRLREI